MKKIILKNFICLCLIIPALFVSGCKSMPKDSGKLNVVSVIFPQYDFARAIGRDVANVSMIMKPGAEIHGFEPSAADIEMIANADVFIYGGGESDAWIDNIFESLDTENIKIIRLMDYAELLSEENPNSAHSHHHEHSDECHNHAGYDEHIWTSPENAIASVEAICSAMCEKDAENAEIYKTNANDYISKISDVDNSFKAVTQSTGSDFIAVGDRFPFLYMAKEYNLRYVAAFSGCSPENDASPTVIVNIIETMKKEKTPVVFYTELSDGKMAATISEETGAKTLMLHSCQSVSKEDFENGKTYVDFMEENAAKLKEALS